MNTQEKLDTIIEKLGNLTVAHARVEENLSTVCDGHDKLAHDIWGNGKPGVKADVQDLKTGIRVLKWVVFTAAGSVISAVGVIAAW